MINRQVAMAAACVALCSGHARGAENYYVSQRDENAADTNPGAKDAPFKTLSRAGEVARPGDHVYIRGGLYRETFRVLSPNDYPATEQVGGRRITGRIQGASSLTDRIVFEAYEDEKVIIDGSEVLATNRWSPVDGKEGVYSINLADALKDVLRDQKTSIEKFEPGYVFWNDQRIMPYRERDEQGLWQSAIPTASEAPTWYYDEKDHRLYAHLGGADPRVEGRIELAVRSQGVFAALTRDVTLSKLTVRRVSTSGISAGSSERVVIEDCRVTHARWYGIAVGASQRPAVRRCFVYDVDGRGIDSGGAFGAMVYDNCVADFALAGRGYFNYAYIVFSGRYIQFQNNVALQAERHGIKGGGFWTDCPGVGHIWMGNAAVHCNFYIESPAMNNLVQWNTVSQCPTHGIYLRANASNLVRENLVEDSGTALVLGSTDTSRHDVAGNVFILNWLKQNRCGISIGSQFGRNGVQARNFSQANVYETKEGGIVGAWAGRSFRTLEEFRAGADQESMGREGTIDYGDLGLAWVRADVPGESHVAFPIFANPNFSRDGTFIRVEPYFWRRGDAMGADDFPDAWAGSSQIRNDPFSGWADQRARPFAKRDQLGVSGWPSVEPVEGTPVGNKILQLAAMKDSVLDERGIGCWSPSLSTVAGAEIDLALWMKPIDIQPAAAGGGAVVYVEWSDWTGQNKSRSYLVGGETGDTLVNPEFGRGSRDWSRVSGRVKAPAAACRFALYLGLRSASGQVMYDAVEQIRTLPGEAPETVREAPVKGDRPLVDPKTLTFKTVDLSALVNRTLADEQADDGKGGWTDQGPGYDMPDLNTGRQEHEGVPYDLLAPTTCVVLTSYRRPQSADLPEQVTLPIMAKARVLYFLHSGAWISEGQRHWTYEVNYVDERRQEIPVIGGVNVRDWGQAGEPYEFPQTANRRTTVWPELVANIVSPTSGLYVMEWLNPYPDTPVKEIRMIAASSDNRKGGVPVLLAVTLGAKK